MSSFFAKHIIEDVLTAENKPYCKNAYDKSRKIGRQGGSKGVTGIFDIGGSVINGYGVKCCFGRAEDNACNSSGKAVGVNLAEDSFENC